MSHTRKPVTLPDGQVIYANIEESDGIDLNPQVRLDRFDIESIDQIRLGRRIHFDEEFEIDDGSNTAFEAQPVITDIKMEIVDNEIDLLSEGVQTVTTCDINSGLRTLTSLANMKRIERSSDEEFRGYGMPSAIGMNQTRFSGPHFLLRDQSTLLDGRGKASRPRFLFPKKKTPSDQHDYCNKNISTPELHRKTIATSPFKEIEASLGTNPLVQPGEFEYADSDMPQIVNTISIQETTSADKITVVKDPCSSMLHQPMNVTQSKLKYTGHKIVRLHEACCLLDKLVKRKFLSDAWWSDGEREQIVKDGKPAVNYDSIFGCKLNKIYTVNLQKLNWLTGCVERKKLHCWPCLLYGRENDSTTGVFDANQGLERLVPCFKKHNESKEHSDAEVRGRQWVKRNLEDKNKTTSKDQQSAAHLTFQPINLLPTGSDVMSEKSSKHSMQKMPGQFHSYTTAGMKPNKDHQKPCIIKLLLKNNFVRGLWQEGEQDAIVMQGRRCPNMEYIFEPNVSDNMETFFTDDLYAKYLWLTGSWEMKQLYCWPCLLYNTDSSCLEVRDLIPSSVIDDHELLNSHLESCLCLKILEHDIKRRYMTEDSEQNIETVKKKREFLKHLIDVVCITKTTAKNSGTCDEDYVELLKLIASYNLNLEGFLNETFIATGKEAAPYLVSNHAKGILTSITRVMVKKIKNEIQNAPFIAIMLDDVKGLVNKSFVSVIIRYVENNGEVHERFIKFIEVGYNRSAGYMIRHIVSLVDELGCESRVVGITYDGAVIEPTDIKKFNSEVRSNINSAAMFFHNRNHNLKFLIQQTLSHLRECRTFFQQLVPFQNFFNDTPAAITKLIEFDSKALEDRIGSVWDFSIDFISTIRCHYTSMLELLEHINQNPNDWDIEHVVQAPYNLAFLKNCQNRFFVVFLSKVFSVVAELTTVLQCDFDANNWTERINQATMKLSQMKNKLDEICKLACSSSLTESDIPPVDEVKKLKESNKELFENMLTCIINFIAIRTENIVDFKCFDSDIIRGLVEKSRGGTREIIALLSTTYSSVFSPIFNTTKLKAQLNFYFGYKCFKPTKTINELMKVMHMYEMNSTMTELHRLIMLLLTIPIASNLIDKTDTYTQIAAYVKNNIKGLNTISAFMWLEKDLLERMQEEENFYESVIGHFVKKPEGEQFRLPTSAKNQ